MKAKDMINEDEQLDVRTSLGVIVQRITYRGTDGLRHTEFRQLFTKEEVLDKCKEQRHLCCKNWRENKDQSPKLQPMSIFNAPTPDFE